MSHRQFYLSNYWNKTPDEPPEFQYNCSWCGQIVEAGKDRCPRCKYPYLKITHCWNLEIEMATRMDRGFSNNEILAQILKNQIKIMDYIEHEYSKEYSKDCVVSRLIKDDIIRTDYMRMFLDEKSSKTI